MIDDLSTLMTLVLIILFYYVPDYKHNIGFFSFCMIKQLMNCVTPLESIWKQAYDDKIYININDLKCKHDISIKYLYTVSQNHRIILIVF